MTGKPVILVLASGRGERFRASGGQGSKLEALLGGVTVLERTLAAVRASGLDWHLEQAAHAGMGDCIAAAVARTAAASGWLVLPADLPFVQPASLQAVARSLRAQGVVMPFYQAQHGHPVGFGAGHREALLALTGAGGAASIVKAAQAAGGVERLLLDDDGIVNDIDTLEDLAAAERRLQRHARAG